MVWLLRRAGADQALTHRFACLRMPFQRAYDTLVVGGTQLCGIGRVDLRKAFQQRLRPLPLQLLLQARAQGGVAFLVCKVDPN